MKELSDLFWTFCRVGGLTFGGGYAMLPMLRHEVVGKRGWATDEEMLDYYAIGQCTPGVIAVNTATFVGYKQRGIAGGIFATAGVIFPSLVIIILIAAFMRNLTGNATLGHAFAGIRVCVVVLVMNTIVNLWKKSMVDATAYFLFFAALAASLFTSLSPIYIVLLAAVSGILAGRLKGGVE